MTTNNILQRFRSIWNPSMFQGWGKKTNYFEGWYYKIISADHSHAYAIIPGIALSNDDNHAFVQMMDGIGKTSQYHRFPVQAFVPSRSHFQLQLAKNQFSISSMTLSLPTVSGHLSFINPVQYQGAFHSPGIMGWYSFVPFMQCYHGLVSLNHEIAGQLNVNGLEVDFTGGKGYIEKDWGSSFPKAWVWTQCNHYDADEDLSIMASVAHIPWLGTHFIGFLALVYLEGRTKIFTTYTNAKMTLQLEGTEVKMTFADKDSELVIRAVQAEGTDLVSPQKGTMTGKVNESLMASHEVSFRDQGRTISARGQCAGLEVGGNSLILLNET